MTVSDLYIPVILSICHYLLKLRSSLYVTMKTLDNAQVHDKAYSRQTKMNEDQGQKFQISKLFSLCYHKDMQKERDKCAKNIS